MNLPLPPVEQLTETPDGLLVTMRAKTAGCPVVFLSAWLLGWMVSEGFALRALISGTGDVSATALLVVWLVVWTIGGLAAAAVLAFFLGGVESLTITDTTLTRRIEAFGKGFSWRWPLAEIAEFRATDSFLAFTVAGRKVRVGTALTDSVAQRIAEDVLARFPGIG